MLIYHKMTVICRSTGLIVHQTSTAQRRTRVWRLVPASHAVQDCTAWTLMSVVHPPHHQHMNFCH